MEPIPPPNPKFGSSGWVGLRARPDRGPIRTARHRAWAASVPRAVAWTSLGGRSSGRAVAGQRSTEHAPTEVPS
eukprot:8461499-Pyramimonas_sp.AAC.1